MSQRSDGNQGGGVPEVTARELEARMDEVVLVDVREAFERRIADLPGEDQRRIPVGELEARMDELDPEAEIVCYCRSGSRSQWAVARLMEAGYERIWNLRGGLLAWSRDVDPEMPAY